MSKTKVGIFVGRMCPIHIGHVATMDKMFEDVGIENTLVVLGSVGQKVSFRVLFSYAQRRKWVMDVKPGLPRLIGIPDFHFDDTSWLDLLMDQINSAFWYLGSFEPVFYGGSKKDVDIFHEKGYLTKVVDRTKVPVSATVIRDLMLRGVDVSDFLHPKIHDDVVKKFARIMEQNEKWETPF